MRREVASSNGHRLHRCRLRLPEQALIAAERKVACDLASIPRGLVIFLGLPHDGAAEFFFLPLAIFACRCGARPWLEFFNLHRLPGLFPTSCVLLKISSARSRR